MYAARLHPKNTGLRDKNGIRIDEGDVIRYTPFNCLEYAGSLVEVPRLHSWYEHWFEELKDMLDNYSNKCDIEVVGSVEDEGMLERLRVNKNLMDSKLYS